MVARISLNTAKFDRKMRKLRRDLRNPRPAMRDVSVALTRYVHGTIRMQGRKRSYAPLAPMTRQKTGKRKALLGLIPHIVPDSGKTFARVKFLRQSPKWDLRMHHRGFTSPAVSGKLMRVNRRQGKPLYFSKRKASKVPAREIIPTKVEARQVAIPIMNKWVDRMAKKWRTG